MFESSLFTRDHKCNTLSATKSKYHLRGASYLLLGLPTISPSVQNTRPKKSCNGKIMLGFD